MVDKATKKAIRNAKAARSKGQYQQLDGPSDRFNQNPPKTHFSNTFANNGRFRQDTRDIPWGQDTSSSSYRLRHQGIQFVSGGKLSQLNDDDPPKKNEQAVKDQADPNSQSHAAQDYKLAKMTPLEPNGEPRQTNRQTNTKQNPNTNHDGPADAKSSRQPSSGKLGRSNSISSEESEVILFRGKSPPQEKVTVSRQPEEENKADLIYTIENGQLVIRPAPNSSRLRPEAKAFEPSASPSDASQTSPAFQSVKLASKNEESKPGFRQSVGQDVADFQDESASDAALQDSDAALRDYVENIQQYQDNEDDWTDVNESSAPTNGRSLVTNPSASHAETNNGQQAEDEQATNLKHRDKGKAEEIKDETMDDEEIARLLSKQASLGMPTDRLILDSEDLVDDHEADFIPFSDKAHTSNRTRSKRNHRARKSQSGKFPDAEALADALDQDPYGGFDVMDFDRPSLKAKKSGRKSGDLFLELSDEELTAQMQATWEKDRAKKAERKKERERLRGEAPGGKVDISVLDDDTEEAELPDRQYIFAGNDMESVKVVIRRFLIDHDKDELSLPIMPNYSREQVHKLAKILRLKSRSYGKDPERFVVLSRNENSYGFNGGNIGEIDNLLAQRKYCNRDAPFNSRPRYGGKKKGGNNDFQTRARATYRDGDVVGASAPELGSDNRGRAMLEKMGWSQGRGIGKEGKEGNVDAIKHVVKTTRAGLG